MVEKTRIKNLERGSAHVWIILVLVLIIIGLLGYVLWQQLTKTDDSDTAAKNTPVKVESPKSNKEDPVQAATKTYTTEDTTTTYVKSFEYPASWSVVAMDNMCKEFNYCASPPVIMLMDANKKAKFEFYVPQSSSDQTVDGQAASVAGSDGAVSSDVTDVGGFEARRVDFNNGNVTIVVKINDGYGLIDFVNPVDEDAIKTVLSSWKWS